MGVAKWTEVAKLGTAGSHPVLCLRIKPTRRKEKASVFYPDIRKPLDQVMPEANCTPGLT